MTAVSKVNSDETKVNLVFVVFCVFGLLRNSMSKLS